MNSTDEQYISSGMRTVCGSPESMGKMTQNVENYDKKGGNRRKICSFMPIGPQCVLILVILLKIQNSGNPDSINCIMIYIYQNHISL